MSFCNNNNFPISMIFQDRQKTLLVTNDFLMRTEFINWFNMELTLPAAESILYHSTKNFQKLYVKAELEFQGGIRTKNLEILSKRIARAGARWQKNL